MGTTRGPRLDAIAIAAAIVEKSKSKTSIEIMIDALVAIGCIAKDQAHLYNDKEVIGDICMASDLGIETEADLNDVFLDLGDVLGEDIPENEMELCFALHTDRHLKLSDMIGCIDRARAFLAQPKFQPVPTHDEIRPTFGS